jgi:hypothetical protein
LALARLGETRAHARGAYNSGGGLPPLSFLILPQTQRGEPAQRLSAFPLRGQSQINISNPDRIGIPSALKPAPRQRKSARHALALAARKPAPAAHSRSTAREAPGAVRHRTALGV